MEGTERLEKGNFREDLGIARLDVCACLRGATVVKEGLERLDDWEQAYDSMEVASLTHKEKKTRAKGQSGQEEGETATRAGLRTRSRKVRSESRVTQSR